MYCGKGAYKSYSKHIYTTVYIRNIVRENDFKALVKETAIMF